MRLKSILFQRRWFLGGCYGDVTDIRVSRCSAAIRRPRRGIFYRSTPVARVKGEEAEGQGDGDDPSKYAGISAVGQEGVEGGKRDSESHAAGGRLKAGLRCSVLKFLSSQLDESECGYSLSHLTCKTESSHSNERV